MGLDSEFNPFVGAQLADPYSVYARARREEPVFFSQVLQMWYVTRYDDIVSVIRDPVRFSSADSVEAPQQDRTRQTQRAIDESWMSHSSLTNNDPPSHTVVRRVVNKAFGRRSRADLERRVRAIATDLVDGFAADGHAEFVSQFGFPLPLRVILNLLGAPEKDQAELKRWSDDWISLMARLSPEQQAQTVSRLQECGQYWTDLIEARRTHPQDDLLSDLIAASAQEPEPIPLPQLVNTCATLTLAGHTTTANLLGNCLRQLLTLPEQWRLVCADPANIPRAVEETLRADTSVHALMRTTTEPVDLGGVALPKGARLALLFASANHDEAYFPDAARFDLRREQTKSHLAFGYGIHHCVGASLARLEGRVALELLSTRLPGLRLAAGQGFAWDVNPIHRGPLQLHIEWDTRTTF